MQFARRFWECMFVDDYEELIYTLFSKFDTPFCDHGTGVAVAESEAKYIRDACGECLENLIERIKATHSMVRFYCMRTYASRRGNSFAILLYPFSTEDLCIDLDLLPESFVYFILEWIQNDMLCAKTDSLMGTTVEYRNCRFDEEIDMLHNRGNLRLFLLFRFFLLESLRSKDPVKQRSVIYDLMVKYGVIGETTPKKEFCESYDHQNFTFLCKQEVLRLIR